MSGLAIWQSNGKEEPYQDPLLYVCDSNNHRIQAFNAKTGTYIREVI